MAGRRQQKIALYLEGHPKSTGMVDEAIVFFKLSSHRKEKNSSNEKTGNGSYRNPTIKALP